MPTTATGTPYTLVETILPNGEQAIYGIPDSKINATNVPIVLHCHGDGGGYDQFTVNAAWNGLRTWMIDNGWGWVESEGGGASSWGSPNCRTSYEQAVQWMGSQINIGQVIVLGRSMGGLVSYWLYALSPIVSPLAAGLIVNSGVTDLNYRYYTHATTTKKAQMRAAYGATSDADWDVKVVGHDPMLFPVSTWNGKNVIQLVGTADDNVLPGQNAYAIRALWQGRPAIDRLDVRQGGDHTTTNGSYLQVAAMTSFMSEVTGLGVGVPTPPSTAFTVTNMYVAGTLGTLYPLSVHTLE